MVETTRIGLIGCGFFSKNHLHSWKDLATQGAEVVAGL
jgi:predicted dehydrogenase